MRFVIITVIVILRCGTVSSQTDTAKMILGDWFYNDGEKVSFDVDQVINFSRQQTNDTVYLQWTINEDRQITCSGTCKKNNYPIGFQSQPVKYYLTNGKSTIYFSSKSYRIITLNKESLTVKRIE